MSFHTPSSNNSKKRVLSSPDFDNDLKKNKTYADIVMSPPPSTECKGVSTVPSREAAAKGDSSRLGTADLSSHIGTDSDAEETQQPPQPQTVPCITIPQEEMEKLSNLLISTFEGQIENLVRRIVSGVTDKLNEKIENLEHANMELNKENANLRNQIQSIEHTLDDHEQYSRRNNMRISGVPETADENTDTIVVNMCSDIGASISLNDIDRSHRVGKPKQNSTKPRDIIVKMCSYRFRQNVFSRRSALKDKGHAGVYINEDLTRKRSLLLFQSRELVRSRHLIGAWSADGNILVKDNKSKVHRIQSEDQLDSFLIYQPRSKD